MVYKAPRNFYSPNKTAMFDCYVEDSENPNKSTLNFLGSFLRLTDDKAYLINKKRSSFTYQTLANTSS